MVYVPAALLKNKDNIEKVSNILNKLDYDIKGNNDYTKEDAIKELEDLKEDIIIEKLKSGFFTFGA